VLRRIGLDAPEGPYETVAGLVADCLGRIPAPGDVAQLPGGPGVAGWQLRVRLVAHHRAERVRIVRTEDGARTPASVRAPEPAGRPQHAERSLS
jgi:CBS domain containing-hemolysin-like protein